MSKPLIIAFIGSRKLAEPQHAKAARLFYQVAYRCAELNITMRSGLAVGADGIAQVAYSQCITDGIAQLSQLEVYIKDETERVRSSLPNKHLAIVRNPNRIKETENLASKVHPNWKACNAWARGMHSRNCHQIFGYELDIPADAVICWTEGGIPSGGTNTAIQLALNANIPVFNLGGQADHVLNMIRTFLISKDVPVLTAE